MGSTLISPLPRAGERPGARAVGLISGWNPYIQVALTYVRQPVALGMNFLNLVIVGWFLLSAGRDKPGAFFAVAHLIGVMAIVSMLLMLVNQLNEQFTGPRVNLMPGFRRVHVTVAVSVAILFTVLLPASFSLVTGLSPVGGVSIMVFLYGMVFWSVLWWRQSYSGWLTWLPAVALLLLIFIEPVRRGVDGLVAGQYDGEAIFLLVIGVAASVLGVRRLVRPDEEMGTYWHQRRWDPTGKRQMASEQEAGEAARLLPGLADWLAERKMARLTYHAHRVLTSRWSRIWRWQVRILDDWLVLACEAGRWPGLRL